MEKIQRIKRYSLETKALIVCLILMVFLINPVTQADFIRGSRPIIRNIEYRMVSFRVREYNQLETENFIIKYKDIDEEILKLVAFTAESKYKQTVDIFQYRPAGKISIILYDDPAPMMQVTMLRKGTPPMGVYYGDSLHILDPTHWVKDHEKMEELFYKEGPVLHELVHLFTDHLGKGNFPIWFTEGVSLYFEYEIDGYQWGKWVDFEDDEYTLEELTNSFNQLDQFLAYTKSFRLIKNYVEEYGLESLIEMIRELGLGANLDNYYDLFN